MRIIYNMRAAPEAGAAMIVEVNGNTRRYRCNDGHPDDNFDDIIFEVTIDE